MVEVTEADRDAVLLYLQSMHDEWCDRIGEGYWRGEMIAIGRGDDDALVQAFARHRLATEAAKDAEIAELVALLREFMPAGVSLTNKNVPDTVTLPLDITMGELRKLSAALAKHGGCDE